MVHTLKISPAFSSLDRICTGPVLLLSRQTHISKHLHEWHNRKRSCTVRGLADRVLPDFSCCLQTLQHHRTPDTRQINRFFNKHDWLLLVTYFHGTNQQNIGDSWSLLVRSLLLDLIESAGVVTSDWGPYLLVSLNNFIGWFILISLHRLGHLTSVIIIPPSTFLHMKLWDRLIFETGEFTDL